MEQPRIVIERRTTDNEERVLREAGDALRRLGRDIHKIVYCPDNNDPNLPFSITFVFDVRGSR